MRQHTQFIILFLLLSPPAHGMTGTATAVSPGNPDELVVIGDACPTFSWSVVEDAVRYELVVYGTQENDAITEPALQKVFPASVSSWTPSLNLCFERGAHYAWSVRALDAASVGTWSTPNLFRVASRPSAQEIALAVELIRQYLGSGQEPISDFGEGQGTPPTLPREYLSAPLLEDSGAKAAAATQLSVDGGVEAVSFTGDGSTLTALDPAALSTGTANIDISGSATGLSVALGVATGGTGATDAATARTNLGAAAEGDYSSHSADANAHHMPPAALPPSGSAGGDLAGTYPNPTVVEAMARDTEVAAAISTHTGISDAHHTQTMDTDTTCNGAFCDGSNFTNLPWASLTAVPAGLDDGDDDTTYAAGTGLTLAGNVFSSSNSPSFAPMGNTISVVDDSSSNVAQYTSITRAADGLPIISYFDQANGDLKVAKCNDSACTGGDETVSTVDVGGFETGKYTSITLGADGFPVISYHDGFGGQALKVAKCNDVACAGEDETISVVDAAGIAGQYTSIILGTDGLPVISYWTGNPEYAIKVAKCNDAACSGGDEQISTLITPIDSFYNAIVLGTDGLPVVVYRKLFDPSYPAVWVAKCNDSACSGSDETHSRVDNSGEPGVFPSITLGADGLPIISYGDGASKALKVAKCNDPACAGSDETITTVHALAGWYTSVNLGTDGLPLVSGMDNTNDTITLVKCNDAACAGADEVVAAIDVVNGGHLSMTVGADGLPVFAFDSSNPTYDLKVAHCGSEFCVPFFRR